MDKERNAFGELLAILSEEELIRFRRRLENKGNRWLAQVLTDEIEERKLPITYPPYEHSKN